MAYSSKYYDPSKAHEYYEKHKKLKGQRARTSIKGLSEHGKVAAKEVKEQLNAEKKATLARMAQVIKNKIYALKEQMKRKMAGMNAGAKDQLKAKMKTMIENMRSDYKAEKLKVKAEYNEKYAAELDKIREDGALRK